MTSDAPRLYLVTPRGAPDESFLDALAAVLATGRIACVRLDLGEAEEADWVAAANRAMPICHEADVPIVIAEHHRLVVPLGLDGVHLAQSRVQIRELRKTLGSDRIIGAFGGHERHRAMVLAEAGADYVSLGPVRGADTLGDGGMAQPGLFEWWAEMIETPSVAEGGVGLEEAAALREIADFVVPDPAAIWDAPDPAGAARAFAAALG